MKPISNKLVAFRITNHLKERLEQVAEDEMMSVSDVCRRSVVKTIKDHESNAKNHRPKEWSV